MEGVFQSFRVIRVIFPDSPIRTSCQILDKNLIRKNKRVPVTLFPAQNAPHFPLTA